MPWRGARPSKRAGRRFDRNRAPLPDTPHLACRVDDMLYEATWMASHLIICAMPPLAAQQTNCRFLSLRMESTSWPTKGRSRRAPRRSSRAVVDEEGILSDIGAVFAVGAGAPASAGHSVSVHSRHHYTVSSRAAGSIRRRASLVTRWRRAAP